MLAVVTGYGLRLSVLNKESTYLLSYYANHPDKNHRNS